LLRKPAFVVFIAGSPNAPRMCQKAGELVEGFRTPGCSIQIPDRVAFRPASDEGRTVMELEAD
jgi:chromosome partitioning protein